MSSHKLNKMVGKYNAMRALSDKAGPSEESYEETKEALQNSKKPGKKLDFKESEGHELKIYDTRKKSK